MAKFIYTAKSYKGESKGGEITAKDEASVAQQLRAEGFLVTSMKMMEGDVQKVSVRFWDRFKGVPLKEKMIFARNLAVMISSGLTVSRAVNNLASQTKSKNFKKILKIIYDDVQSGKSLSDSMAKYPNVFNELFVNMVRVGEAGGSLDEVLNIVANQLEKEHELISKVRGAMYYPAVIIVAMIGIGILMLTYILPRITSVFKDMEVTLPKSTQLIIAISDMLRNHSILIAVLFIGALISLKLFTGTAIGKKIIGFIAINIPLVKEIVIKVNCARFARTYSSLLKSGVSVVDTMKIISNTLENYYYKNAIHNGIGQIQKGVALSKVVAAYPKIFPILVPQMIEVGEETGKTEAVLMKLADFYEKEVDQFTKNLSSIIEPVIMVIIGSAVGFFAVSMLQPMYSLMESIK